MAPDDTNGPRWDWSRISVASLAVVALGAGTTLLADETHGRAGAGIALVVLGSALAGAAALRQ